jgi:hypothetical protein
MEEWQLGEFRELRRVVWGEKSGFRQNLRLRRMMKKGGM